MQRWLTAGNLVWLMAYALLSTTLVWGLFEARAFAISSLNDPSTKQSWQAFRRHAELSAVEGPVRRRVPPSSEAPMLRLLRDHFGASLAAAVFFFSALFFTFMLMVRGVFTRGEVRRPYKFADVEREQHL